MAGTNNGQVFQGSALDVTTANVEGNLTVGGTQVLTGNQTLTGTLAVTGAQTFTGATTFGTALQAGALTGLPVTSTNLNASVSGVVPSTGSNDIRGMLTITQTASIAASNRVCSFAFNNASRYAAAPLIFFCNQSQGLSSSTTYGGVFGAAAVTTAGFDLMINSTATFAGAGTIVVAYFVFAFPA